MERRDRLTPLDASFLHLEDASSHMHVGGVLVFEGEPPAYDDLIAYVESRLHLVPRYRQKLAFVPFAQARPRWVDDPRFDARFHVRDTGLPGPGSEEQLRTLAARIFSRRLSRARPLWELWVVDGLEPGEDGEPRFAMISKTHHAVVDGVAGLDIISALLEPEAESREDESWRPEPEPSGLQLLGEALLERATIPAELFRFARSVVRTPQRMAGGLLRSVAGLGAMARAGGSPAPVSPYNRDQVGPDRRFTWVRASLDDVKAIKNELGGTVNDVVLTVITRALTRHLARRGEDVEELRAFVPVSVRVEDPRGKLGNEVAGMIVPLPVGCADPLMCMEVIGEVTERVKRSGQALGARALTDLAGFAPPTLLAQGLRLSARQRFVNLVVTNVPGPQFPLFLGERRLLDLFPLVPLGNNLTLGVAVVSYNGRMDFGLVGDFDAVPDLDELQADVSEALAELTEAAGVGGVPEPAVRA
jgi:diacylglycerol O-acyltransferase / wax synthase